MSVGSFEPDRIEGLRLLQRAGQFWPTGIAMSVCVLFQTAYWVATPLLLARLIDDGLLADDRTVLYVVLVVLAATTATGLFAGVWIDWLTAKVQGDLLGRLRHDMFTRLQQQSMRFFAGHSEADIVARFSTDTATVEEVTGAFVPWVVIPGVAAIGATFALFQLEWRLALLSMLVWPVSLIGPRMSSKRALDASAARREGEGALISDVQANVAAQPVVQGFSLRDHAVHAFDDRNAELARLTTRQYFLSHLVEQTSKVGTAALQLVLLAWSAVLAFRGELSIGELTAFQALFLLLGSNVDYIMQYLPVLLRSSGGLARIDALLRASPDVADAPNADGCVAFERDLSLDDVTFSYDGTRTSLDGVTLTVPRGASVALVGPSGCGKSTVLDLLMRLYDPQDGAVRVDGRDVRSIRQDAYRALLAPVLQESFLFDASIRENIALGRIGATDAEIERAARDAEIDEAVRRMPDGYDTRVGFRGNRLSGGQRQRVAIARAIVRDPEVLLLDEATSALDPATEAAINETLMRLAKKRTLVSVTHRLSSVTHFDHIIVLVDGRVAEQGTHDELLARDGTYTRLWHNQSGFRISADGDHAEVATSRLRDIPVFSALDADLLEDLAVGFSTERVPPDRVVVHQGDPSDTFYVIARGAVSAVRRTADGTDLPLTVMRDGDYFGELGLLRAVPRGATVRTIADSTFLTLSRDQFLRLLDRAPDLRARLEREYPA